jgi:hypothetical protein
VAKAAVVMLGKMLALDGGPDGGMTAGYQQRERSAR